MSEGTSDGCTGPSWRVSTSGPRLHKISKQVIDRKCLGLGVRDKAQNLLSVVK